MDFTKSIRGFLATLPTREMSGHQKLLAVAAHCAKGSSSEEIKVSDIRAQWPNSTLGNKFSPIFLTRADEAGWIHPKSPGVLTVNQQGLDHLTALLDSKSILNTKTVATKLHIFDINQTHTFDKFLRGIFAQAHSRAWIADSYVNANIFDTVLDAVPPTVEMQLIYNQKYDPFDIRAARFSKEYKKFSTRRYTELHDRFVIIDNDGYIIGPSIKDAAAKSPGLLTMLSKEDSLALADFFQVLWKRAK